MTNANRTSTILPSMAAITCLSVIVAHGNLYAANEDLRPDISEEEYSRGLNWRQANVRQSEEDAKAARAALNQTLARLADTEAQFENAMVLFAEAEKNLNDPEKLREAWGAAVDARAAQEELTQTRDRQRDELLEAEQAVASNRIWLGRYKNDYEAQSDPFAVRDAIARCASASCSASSFLAGERMTVFQPRVLEMIGAHHAYASGLTGRGVRIGIDDDIVSYRLPEFEGRVSFEGANLLYSLLPSDDRYADAKACDEGVGEAGCFVVSYTNPSGNALFETLAVRWIVAQNGWPTEGVTWYLRNDAYEEGEDWRWAIIPHGGHGTNAQGRYSTHGTAVASIAAGRDFGVAPGATIVPIARDFSWEGHSAETRRERSLLRDIRGMPAADRIALDTRWAEEISDAYTHYDIINRSYGIGVFDPAAVADLLEDETQWWGEGLRKTLPRTWRSIMQTGVDPDDRTVVVYAAGNNTEEFGGLGADIPRYETHVRGSQLSVMAVNHDGYHSGYTNFCGPLPDDWDVARWGRHFCVAAPGTANAAYSWGWNWIYPGFTGTSAAAPVVSGALALLMEHFRGQLGNVEIVKRLVNTADNTGHYAQLEIYGAGLIDLRAALQPVGKLATGTPSWHGDTAMTMLSLPPAISGLGRRLADQGVEVASLDSWGAPFWSSPVQFMSVQPWNSPRLTPTFAEPAEHSGQPHLGFTPGTVAIPVRAVTRMPSRPTSNWRDKDGTRLAAVRLLKGEGRIGIEQAPIDGFRWGVLRDNSSWLGGYPSGAFGNSVDSSTAWFGRTARFKLDRLWTLNFSGTFALAHVDLPSGAMLEVDPHLMSTWDIAVERGVRGVGKWSRLSLTQPLRAEMGSGTMTYLAGLKNGAPAYDSATAPLAPQGREVELAFTHETPVGSGRAVLRIAHSFNFLHQPGRTDSSVGIAYRVNLR